MLFLKISHFIGCDVDWVLTLLIYWFLFYRKHFLSQAKSPGQISVFIVQTRIEFVVQLQSQLLIQELSLENSHYWYFLKRSFLWHPTLFCLFCPLIKCSTFHEWMTQSKFLHIYRVHLFGSKILNFRNKFQNSSMKVIKYAWYLIYFHSRNRLRNYCVGMKEVRS